MSSPPANEERIPQPGVLPAKPTLSVCMIVSNEEEVLSRCLKSVQGVADEMIVVDTGSRDNTVSMAEAVGASVFHFKWGDDFAAARNESLKHASGDWILQIDADEELLEYSAPPLRQAMSNPWCAAYFIKCDDGAKAPWRFSWIGRLFRNHPGIRYSRPYHESVGQSVDGLTTREPRWQIHYEPSIVIRHYGYEPSKLRKKYERGLRIMKSYIESNPNDCHILTKLANAYYGLAFYGMGDYSDGEVYLKRALEIDPNLWEANYTLGLILQKEGKGEEAIQCYKKALAGNPLLAEAHASLGAIYVERGMLEHAIPALKRATAVNPELAWGRSNLGLAYTCKGMYEEGIAELKKAVASDPDLASAHMNLAMAYTKKGTLDRAIRRYQKALEIDPDYGKAHYNLAITYYKKGDHRKAVKHFDRAVALGAEIDRRLSDSLEPYR